MPDISTPDAVAAVLEILRASEGPLTPAEIKKGLEAKGFELSTLDKLWRRVQPVVKVRPEVEFNESTRRYRWIETTPLAAPEALERLLSARLSAIEKQALADIVRAALHAPSGDGVEAARQRQAAIDAVRPLAEIAIEVEELTAKQATPDTLIHRLRARVNRSGLEPIDQAGAETTFDRKRHRSIGGSIRDGAPVYVVRPGYVWKAAEEDVLIAKAVVEE